VGERYAMGERYMIVEGSAMVLEVVDVKMSEVR
jgi:hypothetical protein